ncbi:MAG TPA: methyltransferase domain-containing protein [Isosphaeraceae bacterium]|jgi:SAM-dependent methyltransferase|nr:methyltransferase domain-containing protein [Isosphaeraceae bacterium]
MELQELRRHWEAFGRTDPLWAILTDPTKKQNRWDLDDFFREGEREIDDVLGCLGALGCHRKRGRALDFGCGVGRLTQALCRDFDRCDGVDIAATMIEQADRYNRHGDRCRYHHNDRDDLALFDENSFDLIYTARVLQHMQPRYALAYLREFLRVLAPGGLLVFQLPEEWAPAEPGPVAEVQPPPGPLPDAACRAILEAIDPPATMEADGPMFLRVRVTNAGVASWPAAGPEGEVGTIRLGNHWRDADGDIVAFDDGRAPLPRDLGPGDSAEVELLVHPPKAPGRHRLELDVIQEGICWFEARGSAPARLDVDVESVTRFRAEIVALAPPTTVEADAPFALRVRVRNDGDVRWEGREEPRRRFWLGNHWRDGSGDVVAYDDGRAALPRDLGPGEEVEVTLLVIPPATPGRYVLEIDLLQDGVAWFSSRGLEPTRLDVEALAVSRKPDVAAVVADEPAVPIMESHGIARASVAAFLREHGGTVLDVRAVDMIGGGRPDCCYVVTK